MDKIDGFHFPPVTSWNDRDTARLVLPRQAAEAGVESLKERVRGQPAITGTLAGGFGWLSWGLGLMGLFTPHAVLGWLGVDKRLASITRLCGLREIAAGVGILQNPVGPQYMWARVAGDALDLLVLGVALRGRSSKPGRLRLALGVAGAITVADIVMGSRLTQLSASKTAARIAR